MEVSTSSPSIPYKGKTKQEIEDESDFSQEDKALAALRAELMYKMELLSADALAVEHSTSSPSIPYKGKTKQEIEDQSGFSQKDKLRAAFRAALSAKKMELLSADALAVEHSTSSPSIPYKGKTKQEIEDESDFSQKDKALAALMDKKMEPLSADALAALMDKKMEPLSADLRNREETSASVERPCIYVVHEKFSRTSTYAYTPETVSIGPVHRDKKNLQVMEDFKERYMNTLLSRTPNRFRTLHLCVGYIRILIERARKCYSEQIRCDDTIFIIMMIVDGLFIIEFLLRYSSLVPVYADDLIFNNYLLLFSTVRDLILFENQIPMVVLEQLFTITCSEWLSKGKTLEQLAIRLFVDWIPITEQGRKRLLSVKTSNTGSKHLLDLVRNSLQSSFGERVTNSFSHTDLRINSLQLMQVPCVTELRKAGIKLRQRTNAKSIFDIKFRNGVLEIPPLLIRHQTDTLFRNVIACEQYCDGNHSQMTSYAFLMDGLINTPNDVEILRDKGIIQHSLGSDEYVSSLFNNLCCEVCLTEYKYDSLCRDLNVYYSKQWNKWFQDLREYFRTPWKATSIIVAVLVLLLTAGGFVSAVLALILPGPK